MSMNPSETKFGTFDELVAGFDSEIVSISRNLRALILKIHPHVVEVVRLGDGAASYGIGPKKMSEAYSYIMPKESYVNLGFYYGVSLADPAGLMEGTGKNLRHVKVRSIGDVTKPALRELIKSAFAERRKVFGRA
jgi:hypothetical protein